MDALTFDANGLVFTLNVDKETLEKAPGFEEDKWPDESQYEKGWLLDVYPAMHRGESCRFAGSRIDAGGNVYSQNIGKTMLDSNNEIRRKLLSI